MSTNSSISIRQGDKIKTIYCHWDGYISHNGVILLEHYTDKNKVNDLIELGNISALAENIEPKDKGEIRDPKDWTKTIETDKPHSYDNAHLGVVIAYGRDRGETGQECREYDVYTNKNGEERYLIEESYEFDYLFENGQWFVRYGKVLDWTLLSSVV